MLRSRRVSVLGSSLAGQGRFEEAEPLLFEGYEGLRDNSAALEVRRHEALERLVDLYDAWGKPEQAAEWRTKLPKEQEAVASHKPGQSASDEKQDE